LQALDVANNRIYSMQNIEELNAIDALMELSIDKNPINVHKDLQDELTSKIPSIEVLNN